MNPQLSGKTIAILVADGYEQRELTILRRALEVAGASTVLVSLERGSVRGWVHDHFGESSPVDATVDESTASDFDGLLLPGGVLNSDALRASDVAVKFVRNFFYAGKPVGAICHGAQILIDAGVLRDRTLTSFPSVRADFKNAGANWVDAAVVVDRGLVTGRSSDNLEDFTERMIVEFSGEPVDASGAEHWPRRAN